MMILVISVIIDFGADFNDFGDLGLIWFVILVISDLFLVSI